MPGHRPTCACCGKRCRPCCGRVSWWRWAGCRGQASAGSPRGCMRQGRRPMQRTRCRRLRTWRARWVRGVPRQFQPATPARLKSDSRSGLGFMPHIVELGAELHRHGPGSAALQAVELVASALPAVDPLRLVLLAWPAPPVRQSCRQWPPARGPSSCTDAGRTVLSCGPSSCWPGHAAGGRQAAPGRAAAPGAAAGLAWPGLAWPGQRHQFGGPAGGSHQLAGRRVAPTPAGRC